MCTLFLNSLIHQWVKFHSILLHQLQRIVTVVRFEVFTAATMKNGVFWDVTPFRRKLAPPSSG
jgi:hypothetical protein